MVPGVVRRLLIAAALTASVGPPSAPASAQERVDDFALLDHRGRFHELQNHADATAVVLFVQGNGCPISRKAVPVMNALRAEFEPRGVVFLGLNANLQDDRRSVAREVEEYGLELPVLIDETQLVAEALGVRRTAEVFVVDPRGWNLVYRGPIDDRLDYGTQKPATRAFLREALLAQLAGEPLHFEARESPGCLIFFPHAGEREPRAVSYADDVAPILMARCGACHREGGVAPWAMTSFSVVQGWSPMIREVVRTRRMPPWHADPHVGRFSNDISLEPGDARKLVHWIEAGALRGVGPDPLEQDPSPPPPPWPLGTPDLVLEASRQEIPATGVVDYRYETVPVPLESETWLRAVDIRPSNPRVTHHATAYIVDASGAARGAVEGPGFARGLFAGFVPGREPEPFLEGTGFRLPPGSRIRFQLHYNTTGRQEVDTPRIGLYFHDGPVEHELKIGAAVNTSFEIPAGARDYEATAEHTLEKEIIVYALTPHMHFRGKRMAIEAHYANGAHEVLLNVPSYDFNWQRRYALEEPLRLPRGTRIIARAGFDNSDRNPANPDASRAVGWGEQSFDEMLISYFLYTEATPARLANE